MNEENHVDDASSDDAPGLTEEEVEITKESLAQSIADLVVDSTKSDRNQKLHNHAATLRMYARHERLLTDNYGVKSTDDDETK